jgi:DNA replication and repair protein RecF
MRQMPAVTRLTLTRFRNYRAARIEVEARPVVLCGPNGAGKTNLLEALSFLSPGRGLRRARLPEIVTDGTESDAAPPDPSPAPKAGNGWAVAATLSGTPGVAVIGTGWEPGTGSPGTPGRERRLLRIDGQPVRTQTVLAGHLSLLWLTPQMDRLFVEGSGGRRRFLDRLVFGFDAGHAGRLARYEHALRERARLLREGVRDPSWLAALEDQMATTGVAVTAARREAVQRLNRACAAAIGPFPQAELAVSGVVEGWLDERPALLVEDAVRLRLREQRSADAESGSAAVGAHRSDVLVSLRTGSAGMMPADRCSTGEQKALLLAIVLANARLLAELPTGPPLLLLDEVVAHLDADRRAALFREVMALGGQAWLTGTDAPLFAPLKDEAQFVSIVAGRPSTMDSDGRIEV